jgi:hypothetical protein
MREIANDAVSTVVRRRARAAVLPIGILLCGAFGAQAANAPKPAPGEEYISAIQGGPIHAPEPAPARKPGEGAGPAKPRASAACDSRFMTALCTTRLRCWPM